MVVEKSKPAVTEFFFVDTSKRSPEVLFHPAGRRQYVILFDLIFNTPEELLKARKTTELLFSKVPKEELVAIAGITPKDGLKFYCTFTTDRNRLISGLNAIGKEKMSGLMEGPDGNYYPAQFSANSPAVKLDPDETFLQNVKVYSVDEKKKEDLRGVVLQGLVELGFLFSTMDGRKNLILFSQGFDTGGLSVDLGLQDNAPSRAASSPAASEPEHKDYDAMIKTTRNPEELERAASAGPGRRPKQQGVEALSGLLQGTDACVHVFQSGAKEYGFLKDLAKKTAGYYFYSAEPAASLDQTLASDQNFYVVGWQPNLAELKHLNSVELHVKDREISGPEKWLAREAFADYTPLEKKMLVDLAIYKDYGTAAGSHFWTDFIFESGIAKIVSFVQMEGEGILVNKTPEGRESYELYSFSLNQDESVSDFNTNILELDLKNKNLVERLNKSGIKIWNILLGGESTSTVRCVLVHTQTGDTLSRSVPLEINNSELTMSSPFFPALSFDWILWPKPDEDRTKRGVSIRFPYRAGQDFFCPDLSPTVKKTDTGRVFYVKFYNLLPESKNPPISLFLVDQNGKSIEIQKFGLMKKPNTVEHGGMELFWQLNSIPDVSPGTYLLKVDIRDPLKNRVISRQVPIQITM
jgi:hypothetical protein